MKNEIWKKTHIYPECYEVSNYGNVRSVDRWKEHNTAKSGYVFIQGVMLKQSINKKGYPIVYLSQHNKQKTVVVHRLVAMAFVNNPNPEKYDQVNHIDGNKQNNHYSNLEWCDNSYNQIHAYEHELHRTSDKSGRKNIPVLQINKDTNEIINRFASIAEACRQTGKSQCCIKKGIYKQTKSGVSGGFIWELDIENETN